MYKLTKNNEIYIGCPPQYASGGPELLHQLCFLLNKRGYSAYMYYNCKEVFDGDPVAERFKHYHNPYKEKITDSAENIFIVPETLIDYLNDYQYIGKCVWWLGINHYLLPTELCSHKYLRVIWHYILMGLRIKKPMTISELKKKNIYCWAQCWYAVSFLLNKGLHNVAYLSDYISEQFFENYNENNFKAKYRKNIVLYNPKRNTKYIEQIIKQAPDIKFVAIENMRPDEVKKLMSEAKVYIDFGSHPGKDRLPRESAIQGCCILTSTLGSANFFDDVPILSEYKYERKKKNISMIVQKIRMIFDNYDDEIGNFKGYRDYILHEKEVFEKDIDKLFILSEDKGE
ncbi:hypothetical protein [Faecalimonas umbilicata]|jgi:hypothetical protein|uniref:hypothetical protein n=1 Tax=Faecalimonas umbilicata TaxID=1912855 RepID=UPI0022E0B33E|nr:hypothetical protein [Faecalimonas umbilicata]